jgi:hypothetical protein
VHQGVYACTARTPTKERGFEPVRREIAVLISGPPRVRLLPTDGTIGGQAEMRCHVYGYPFPTDVVWTRVGQLRPIDTYRDPRFSVSRINLECPLMLLCVGGDN